MEILMYNCESASEDLNTISKTLPITIECVTKWYSDIPQSQSYITQKLFLRAHYNDTHCTNWIDMYNV